MLVFARLLLLFEIDNSRSALRVPLGARGERLLRQVHVPVRVPLRQSNRTLQAAFARALVDEGPQGRRALRRPLDYEPRQTPSCALFPFHCA